MFGNDKIDKNATNSILVMMLHVCICSGCLCEQTESNKYLHQVLFENLFDSIKDYNACLTLLLLYKKNPCTAYRQRRSCLYHFKYSKSVRIWIVNCITFVWGGNWIFWLLLEFKCFFLIWKIKWLIEEFSLFNAQFLTFRTCRR